MNEIIAEHKNIMEKIYNQLPETRPSEATAKANALREQADQIEQQEMDRRLAEYRQKKIIELRNITLTVKDKLNQD